MEKQREEIYNEVCEIFRAKLKEITDPVALNEFNRSYDSFADVISNVILLEINLGKKPWDSIPKKELRLPKVGDALQEIMRYSDEKEIAKYLFQKLGENTRLYDCSITSSDVDKEYINSLGVYSALKNWLEK